MCIIKTKKTLIKHFIMKKTANMDKNVSGQNYRFTELGFLLQKLSLFVPTLEASTAPSCGTKWQLNVVDKQQMHEC